MNKILLADSSLRTEDCKSHLFTQTMKGILILLARTPSGRGISIFYSSLADGIPNYCLNFMSVLLEFPIFIELGLFEVFKIVLGCVTIKIYSSQPFIRAQ